MVFHTFGVAFGNFGADANSQQKLIDNLVFYTALFGQLLAFLGKEYRAVGFGGNVAVALQASEGFAGCGLGDAHSVGHINQPGFAVDPDQIIYQFDIVLYRLVFVRLAHTGEALGLFGNLGQAAIDCLGCVGRGV